MQSSDNFAFTTDQTTPKFIKKLIINNDAELESLYRYKLIASAEEQDYKDFVEYIANYIGVSVNELLDMADGKKKAFTNFEQPQN